MLGPPPIRRMKVLQHWLSSVAPTVQGTAASPIYSTEAMHQFTDTTSCWKQKQLQRCTPSFSGSVGALQVGLPLIIKWWNILVITL